MKTKNTPFKLFFIAYVLLTLILYISSDAKAQTKQEIGVDYKIGINYVTHLYTLGEIGYSDSEYKTQYSTYITEEDKNVLQKYKELLLFGQGAVGRLTPYFFFIPAFSDLKTYEDFKTYFDDIANALSIKSTKPIEPYIPNENKKYLDISLINDLLSLQVEFNEISQVYLNNVEVYLNEVYPEIVNDLENQKYRLNNLINNNDIINKWQNVTNYSWEKGDYIYLLFKAGKKGPSFNNLSENINSCYFKIDENYIVDMFSHEFGIFLMYDSIMPLTEQIRDKYPDYKNEYTVGRPYWMAFEMLSVFFNAKINNRKTKDYYSFKEADPMAFMEIYSQLYNSGVTNPKDLYCKGIEEYMKPEGYWKNGVKERYEKLKTKTKE